MRKSSYMKDPHQKRIISTLDERFSGQREISMRDRFLGAPWKVVSIDENVVSVEPSMEVEAAIPDWVGEDIPVSYETARGFLV